MLSEAYNFSPDELTLPQSRNLETYCAYNVMMVRRVKEGFVERAGVGRIFKAARDVIEEKWEDVVIG
jgi:hypothetical protein